ncbi:MAG TPA: hypothetical protein VGS12_05175 [Caulobacteraceae bacterium]|nr:hypothetical protein [Caulobacteraceae bacterium]
MAALHWLYAVSGSFNTAADWTSGLVPGSADTAILDAAGGAFTVTASSSVTVSGVETAKNATLSIGAGTFTASGGTGAGASAGTLNIGDGAALVAGGAIANSGFIDVSSTGDVTSLLFSGSKVTLSGGGVVALSDNGANTLDAQHAGTTLENVDNKIKGVGQIGSANLTVINDAKGIIKANGALALVLTGAGITNAGAIKDAINSAMIVSSTTVANAGGLLKAKDGAVLTLQGATIEGGTLSTVGSGVIETSSNGASLDGSASAVANAGTFLVPDNTSLALKGTIANSGVLELAANLGSAAVSVSNVTLTGAGTVAMSDSSGNAISSASASTLTNVNDTISGSGALGSAQLTLVNDAGGTIDASGSSASLVINTGSNSVTNDGLIEATGTGSAVGKVQSAVVNNGTLAAAGGTLQLLAAVTGSGSAKISAGELSFAAAFTQNVAFTGTSGTLLLFKSQSYTGTISGFSLTGGTRLDLRDIGFARSNEATFSGNSSGGTLTVTDGSHTAHILLAGNYTSSTWVCSADGSGGVIVVDPPASGAGAFAQAMAGLPAATGVLGQDHLRTSPEAGAPLLALARLP